MPITQRVDVDVIDQTLSTKVPSFTIPMVLGTSGISAIKDEVLVFGGMEDVPDAVDVTTEEYQMLQKIFSQQPSPDTVYLYDIDRDDYAPAELTTGSEGTEITWRSLNEGSAGENIQVELEASANTDDLSVEFFKSLWIMNGGDTATYNPDSTDNDDLKVISKQADYDNIFQVEITTGSGLSISITDPDDDGVKNKLNIQIDATYGNTVQEVADAINNHGEASALFKAVVGGDGSGTIDTALATEDIPFSVLVHLQTDAENNVQSTAEEVADAVGDSENTDAPLVVSASSDGQDNPSAVGPSSLSTVSSSPAELVRALHDALEYCDKHQLDHPYFLLSTTYGESSKSDEVDGDRKELSDAVATRMMIYGTSNRMNESATDARVLANTMASSRSFVFADKNKEKERRYPEASLIGKWAGHNIAEGVLFDTMWSNLNVMSPAEFNSTEQARLEGQAPNNSAAFTYASTYGTEVVTGSWSTSGEYLDWTLAKDYIEARTEAGIVGLLESQPIVLGDSRGLALLQSTITEIFDELVSKGIIGVKEQDGARIKMYELEFPSLDEWSEMDRAQRNYVCSATISPAWAIEQVNLTIYATLDTDQFGS